MQLKRNKCEMKFKCTHSEEDECVYFFQSNHSKDQCRYCFHDDCCSVVAIVNRIILFLKECGLSINYGEE